MQAISSSWKNTVVGAFASLILAVVACGSDPKYPKCENDEHCQLDGKKGLCLKGTCVECRSDANCRSGFQCIQGKCEGAAYCDERAPCPGGKRCEQHSCVTVNKGDSTEEPSKTAIECSERDACPKGQNCQNGHCVSPPNGGPGCEDFAAPQFDYESASIKEDTKSVLNRLAGCVINGPLKGKQILLVGHCDNRGEYEFNLSLGAERAEIVRNYLLNIGVIPSKVFTSSRGKLDAVGLDDAGWAHDRRVDIEIR